MTYRIQYTNGYEVRGYETYEEAVQAVMAEYPEAEIGHDGDLSDGGERTLCWADEESSIDDDGLHAVCSIRKV